MRHTKCLLVIIVILALSVCLYAQEPKDEPVVATIGPTGVQRVEILGGNYWFTPHHIVVRLDTPVELNVSRESGAIPHDITMQSPEAGMYFTERLGTIPKAIRFTPTKTGSYPFYCTLTSPFGKTHRERGMEGVIEVVP